MPNIPRPSRIRSLRRGTWLGLAVAGLGWAGAAEPPADKSQFTLFHPTPVGSMRELSTDRPDTTESPITVDAGHYLLELSFADYTYDKSRGVRHDVTIAAPFNFKVGLLNQVDLQFVWDPYVSARTRTPGAGTVTVRGVGDAEVRLKINFWGNDGPQAGFGLTSFGLIPFLKIPIAKRDLGNGRVEGGLIFPFAVELPAGFDLGAMLETDFLRDNSNSRYGVEIVHSVTLGHTLFGGLRGYVEFVGISPLRTGRTYRAFYSTGLTYLVAKNVQLDVGTRIGLSSGADAFNIFSGLSVRF